MNTKKLNELITSLEELATNMSDVAMNMRWMIKDRPAIAEHGAELMGASYMAAEWADGIREELEDKDE